MKTLFTTLIACTLFTSASFAHPHPNPPTTPVPPVDPVPPQPIIETLRGFTYDESGFTIQVDSNGCTGKDSFEVLQLESYPAQVQFNRIALDNCRAFFPYGTKITYTYAELGLSSPQSFILLNQIDSGVLPKR